VAGVESCQIYLTLSKWLWAGREAEVTRPPHNSEEQPLMSTIKY
jgi:hypothetical protein